MPAESRPSMTTCKGALREGRASNREPALPPPFPMLPPIMNDSGVLLLLLAGAYTGSRNYHVYSYHDYHYRGPTEITVTHCRKLPGTLHATVPPPPQHQHEVRLNRSHKNIHTHGTLLTLKFLRLNYDGLLRKEGGVC